MAAFAVLDNAFHSSLRILDVATLANFVVRNVGAVLLSKLWTIRRSNDHVQDLELILKVHVLVKLRTLGRTLVTTLEASEVMRILSLALDRIYKLEILANLLKQTIFKATVLLVVELQLEDRRVTQACPHGSRREQPHLLTLVHTSTMS